MREVLGDGVRLRAAAVACALMLAVAACGGDDGGGDGEEATDSMTPSTTSAPTTALDPTAEVEAAYFAYWDAYLKAVREPVNPELPELQALMTGEHMRGVTRNLRNMQGSGQAVREREGSQYRNVLKTVELDETIATFTACTYDDLVTYDIATGEPIDDSAATKQLEGQMVLEGEQWKVAQLAIVAREDGEDHCPG